MQKKIIINNVHLKYFLTKLYFWSTILIGDQETGKSSIMKRFTNLCFTEWYSPTSCVEFRSRKIITEENEIKMRVWDTSGSEKYQHIVTLEGLYNKYFNLSFNNFCLLLNTRIHML